VWLPQEVCITLFVLVEPSTSTLVIGVREEWIERYPKAFVAYLNNMDVGQPLCKLNHVINQCLLCFTSIYILLPCSRLLALDLLGLPCILLFLVS
jgi:hypothetical protein